MSLSSTHSLCPGFILSVALGKSTEIMFDQRPKPSDRRKNGPQVGKEAKSLRGRWCVSFGQQ